MPPSWDDLRIFLSLAREGTLTTAAKALGVSHPTVARRVQALEKQIGARLFERLPDRFVPTPAGEELLADTEAMEKAALSINRRSAGLSDTVSGVVRLSAGEAMAAWLARHLPEMRKGLTQIEFELTASHTLANLSRREADLLIREQVPDLHWLVLHEGCRAGAGLAVLPCYLGDPDPQLQRLGDVLPEVFADQWLLVHRDLRALPRVRAVMDAMIVLFQRERPALEGATVPATRREKRT